MKKLPIVFITDKNYIVPTVVAIQSLINNFDFCMNLDIYIMTVGVEEEKYRIFNDFKRDKLDINIIPMDSFSSYDESGYYVSSTALFKCVIPRLLPQYDKILYIDGDVIVKGNIIDLFEINVEKYYVAAVSDIAAVEQKWDERLGLENYFNSGVLLFNAKKYREDKIEELFWKTKKEHPDYKCMDQDVFNDVFHNNVLFLPPNWNLMRYNIDLLKKDITEVNNHYGVNFESLDDLERKSTIIHLTNKYKPWIYNNVYMSKEWMNIYLNSPLKNEVIDLIETIEPTIAEKEYFEIVKIGFLRKESTIYETVLYCGKIGLLRKEKTSAYHKYKLFKIPVFTYYFDDYEYLVKVCGIPVWRKVNEEGIQNRLLSCYGNVNASIDRVCNKFVGIDSDRISNPDKLVEEINIILKMENK